MRTALLLVIAFVFAGCATPATLPKQETVDEVDSTAASTIHHLNATFQLTINPDLEVIGIGGTTENCVFFWDTDGADYQLFGVNATLSWDAMTPLAESMRIRVNGADDEYESKVGSSPVEASFGDITPRSGGWGVGFWADYTMQAPITQVADLAISFDYTGTLPDPDIGSCSGGGL